MTNEKFMQLAKDGFYVKINDRKELMAVLEMCEKNDIKWSDSSIATHFYPNTLFPYFILVRLNKWSEIVWTHVPDRNYKKIDIKEFLSPKQEIHITSKGNETHAILKQDGKVVKHTIAKCHPDDEYDFEIGSNIACGRLFSTDMIEHYVPLFNCKFVVVEGSKCLQKGKVYEVKDGNFKNDIGRDFPLDYKLQTLEDLDGYLKYRYSNTPIKYIILKD